MAESLSAVINFGFENMRADLITAFPSSQNPTSVNILEKLNFKLMPDTFQHSHQNVEGLQTYVLDNFAQEKTESIGVE
jgi:ribosomal-protein-alanine N-acetyltransferase